jgi:DNA-directed RNA polymerase sigma subunit (sigma70/sigma32)
MATDEFLSEIDIELFVDTIWHRNYTPTLLEMKHLIEAYVALPTRDQHMIAIRFRRPDGRTLSDVGEVLDLGRERVRQMEESVLATLRGAVGSPQSPVNKRLELARPVGRPRPVIEEEAS